MASTLVQLLTNIADAIREKKGTTDKINAQSMAFEITTIEPLLDTIELKDPGKYDVKDYKYAQVLPSDVVAELMGVLQGTATEVHIPEGTTKLRQFAIEAPSNKPLVVYMPTTIEPIVGIPYDSFIRNNSASNPAHIKFAGTFQEWLDKDWGLGDYHYLYINDERITEISTITNFSRDMTTIGPLGRMVLDKVFIPDGSTVGTSGLSCCQANEIYFEGTINGELGVQAFNAIKKNTKIHLPTNITIIPRGCFQGTQFDEFTVPEGVTEIQDSAFSNTPINQIILPSTLATIDNIGVVTYEVRNKTVIVLNATTPPTATTQYIFGSYFPKVIFVPVGTLTAYRTATNWSRYADYFAEMNQISLNAQAEILNNETYQYSIDGGVTWLNFTSEITNFEQLALIKFKNTNETTKLLIGKTAGATDIGSITDAELTYVTEGSMTIYLRLEEITA